MAKITLDAEGGEITFESINLLYIGFDEESQSIILCLKGMEPQYLPLTPGNLDFLQKMTPHVQLKAKRDLSAAQDVSAKSSTTAPMKTKLI